MKIFFLILITSLSWASFGSTPAKNSIKADSPDVESVSIKVHGMVCDFCAQGVTKHFMKQKEVHSVKVDLDTMTINLAYNPGQSLTEKQLEKMVKKSGGYDYKGVVSKLQKKDKAL